MKTKLMTAAALCMIFTMPALAEEKVAAPATAATTTGYAPAPSMENCPMVETISFSININSVSIEIGAAGTYMAERAKEIEALAKDVGLDKFELQGSNFSVYTNYSGGCGQPATTQPMPYMLSGGLTYNLNDAAKAGALAKKIEAKGYSISLNSNAYRQCQ